MMVHVKLLYFETFLDHMIFTDRPGQTTCSFMSNEARQLHGYHRNNFGDVQIQSSGNLSPRRTPSPAQSCGGHVEL